MGRHGFEIKTNEQIILMREAGLITAAALREVRKAIRPGITTLELDAIAEATFGLNKTSEGLQALEWFKQGKMLEIAEYCCFDVKITKMVHEYGMANGQIYFTNKFGKKITVPVLVMGRASPLQVTT